MWNSTGCGVPEETLSTKQVTKTRTGSTALKIQTPRAPRRHVGRPGCASIHTLGPATNPCTLTAGDTSTGNCAVPGSLCWGIPVNSSLPLWPQHASSCGEGQHGSGLEAPPHCVLHVLPAESRKGKSLLLGTQLSKGHCASRTARLKKVSRGPIPP